MDALELRVLFNWISQPAPKYIHVAVVRIEYKSHISWSEQIFDILI